MLLNLLESTKAVGACV